MASPGETVSAQAGAAADAGGRGGPGRGRRAAVAAAQGLGLALVFGLASAGGALLHLGLPLPRRFAAARVNAILEGTFRGKVRVDRVGALGVSWIEGVDAEVFDPEGQRVLDLHGVSARLGTLTLLRSLIGGDRLVVHLPELHVDWAHVLLEENAAGELGLVRAFESRAPATGQPPSAAGPEISIAEIHVNHTWAHGHTAAVPVIDVDLDDLSGAFTSTPESTAIDIHRLSLRGRGLPGMNPEGSLSASLSLPAQEESGRRASARYEGQVGEIPVIGTGALTGKQIDVVVDVLETMPGAIAALAPGRIQLGAPVSAHAEVHGELPVLTPELRARIGDGELHAGGAVTLPVGPRTELLGLVKASVKDLDVSLLQQGSPATRLTAELSAAVVSRPGGKVAGSFELVHEPGEVGGQVVPAAQIEGRLTERSVRGEGLISEPGAFTRVAFALAPEGGQGSEYRLDFNAETTIPSLGAIRRVGPIGRGRARVRVRGQVNLATKEVAATATGEVSGLDVSGVRLARGWLTGAVRGPAFAPRFVAGVEGAEMSAGGFRFSSVRASAAGSPRALDLSARWLGEGESPHVAARGHLETGTELAVSDALVRVEREDVATTATIRRVRVAGRAVEVTGLTLHDLGKPVVAAARIAPAGVTFSAQAPDVEMARVVKLLGRDEDVRGHLAFDVDAATRGTGVTGHVDVRVRDLAMQHLEGANVHVWTAMERNHLRAEVAATLGEAGRIDLSTPEVALGGPALLASSWRTATGTLMLDGVLDLEKALGWLPPDGRPVAAASGTVRLRGRASRSSPAADPGVELEASTSGLALTGKVAVSSPAGVGTTTPAPLPWRTTGLDGTLALRLLERSGETQVSASLHGRSGVLATMAARARLPLSAIAKSPEQALALVKDTPLLAKLEVPRRSLDRLPAVLGKVPVKGEVEVLARLGGTLRAPRLSLTARGTKLLARDAAACVMPLEIGAGVAYDGENARARLTASSQGREVLSAGATAKVSAARVVAGEDVAWEASGKLTLASFPLDTVGAFLRQPIGGTASGAVAVVDLHRAAALSANLDLHQLELDQTVFPSGEVHVELKDGALAARVRLDQADGHAEVSARGAMSWGAALRPSADLAKPLDIEVRAKSFRANAAMPFVTGIVSELDGRIDADAKVHVERGGKIGEMTGAMEIRDGVLEIPQIGERFHQLRGRIVMRPWGTLRFEDFHARAPTGSFSLSADAVLKGFAFRGGSARVHIPPGESIPITFEGVPLGRAHGDIEARARMSSDGRRLDVHIDIPVLRAELPQSTGHAVQPLEPDPTIRIGHVTGARFTPIALLPPREPRPPRALDIHVTVKLGSDVEIRRDTTLQVVLHGEPQLELDGETRVSGEIRLDRGKLELQGRQFIIDHGVLGLGGRDPPDPLIFATAYWDAPDGTRVFADFSGRVSSGSLTLRSEPPLGQDEILALVLFGSRDGTFGAERPSDGQSAAGAKAAGIVGGLLTQGLNKALSGITGAEITTRVDTSEASNPRPEVAIQLSRSISARLSYMPNAPGENPERTRLTLDWRFLRNWSLVAEVGEKGSTTVDVVWRLRY